MPLYLADPGTGQTVKRITGTPEIKKRLEDLGFTVGGSVEVVNAVGGDIIVRVKDSRIALDRGLAGKIMI